MIDIKMQPTEIQKLSPKITVIGVGGAGGNAVNNMMASSLEGCEFLVCNTDAQALEGSLAENGRRVQLGANVTGGLGAGSKPEIGKAAAEESLEEVLSYIDGANMVFVTAGMGGGTGTGAAPVIAKACRDRGILTVGVVTKPFHFEGSHRMKSAEAGIEQMQEYVDTLIVIPNQNLFRVANENTTFADAFQMADSVLKAGVQGVTDLIVRPGIVNLDFADIRTGMLEMGKAMMGTGEADGDKRAIEAAESAINNPLLDDVSMKGARGVIINVTGGYDMTLFEADEACNRIRDEVDPEANIIFGATFDQSLEGKMRVSIVATGIEKESETKRRSGGGGLKIDAIGKSTLERAKPNTEETAQQAQMSAESAQTTPQQPVGQQYTTQYQAPAAPASVAAPPPIVGSAGQDQELDMFEQREFVQGAASGQNEIPQNTAMHGTRYKDSFIPPKPAEPVGGSQAYISSFHGAHIPQQESAPVAPAASAPAPASSLTLNPPKQPAAAQTGEKKRTPSLFERITDSVQGHLHGIGGGSAEQQTQTKQRTAPAPAASQASPAAATTKPLPQMSQGSLNIDAPAGPAGQGDDELDIPAFLRRQAN